MGETVKKTLLAALAAWLLTRMLRRLVGVALLAAVLTAAATIAGRHGVDLGGVRRVVHCETQAIARAAKQLHDPGSSNSPSDSARTRRTLLGAGRCHPQSDVTARRQRDGAQR